MPVIGLVADDGHKRYSFGMTNLYLPFPYPLTGAINSALFRLVNRFPAAVMESPVISIISVRPNIPSNSIYANSFLAFSFVLFIAFKLSIAVCIERFREVINTFSSSIDTFSVSINTFSTGTL